MTLACKNLSVSIGKKIICHELNIEINPGEVWGILGPNGCGKTTLLYTLIGILPAAQGEIWLHEQKLSKLSIKSIAQSIGLLFQEMNHRFLLTVYEYCLTARFPHRHYFARDSEQDRQIVFTALQDLGIAELAHKPLPQLSGGEKRRAAIAALLVQNPAIYLLDEPTNHLDIRHQMLVLHLFRQLASQGGTIMMTLHDINLAQQFCTHLLFIFKDGEVLHGKAKPILTAENLCRLFDYPVHKLSNKSHSSFWWPE